MKLLLTIKDKDNQITSKNINMINTIIVASVKYILEQKCMEPELDSDILTRDLMNIIRYTISNSHIEIQFLLRKGCKFMAMIRHEFAALSSFSLRILFLTAAIECILHYTPELY